MSKSIASTSSLIFYGIGNLSPAIKSNFLGAPIFYYYNNVLGLDALLVSLALAIALIIDGITDPLIGYFSDYTKSRLGRRHPYIFASILPGALFTSYSLLGSLLPRRSVYFSSFYYSLLYCACLGLCIKFLEKP